MTKFYYVYLLIDVATETHRYTGVTEDLQARLTKHNAGEVPHTSKFKPWRIQTAIAFDNKEKLLRLKHILKHTAADHSPTDTFDLCPKTFSAVANICKRWYIITERNQ